LPALAVLLRPGGISRTAIEALIGPVLSAADPIAGAHPSPGMHPRHYSPRTPLFLIQDGNWTELEHQGKSSQPGKGLYLQHSIPPNRDVTIHQMPRSAAEYAAALYGTLHHADMQSYKWIAVDVPPATPEWEAVLDRLTRAAMKRAER
jgi:L-threonylcarbamoyladenylate synthase